jgi:hypothetical protein
MLKNDCLFSERKYEGKNVTAQHFTLTEIEEVMGSKINNYDIFTIVRNPFDRIVSEYLHIKYNDWAISYKNLSFEDFIAKSLNTLTEERIRIFDAHLELQSSFLQGNNNNRVKIFKYENLNEVFEWLKITTKESLVFGHERKSDRKHYKEYFTNSNTVERVINFYAKDFELFGYSTQIKT